MSFEKTLLSKCAPTLASLKTGNLFSVSDASIEDIEVNVSIWNKSFESKGVKLHILKHTSNTSLIYVYRESALKKDLAKPDIFKYLKNYGYDLDNINQTLKRLQMRLNSSEDFPHEIGLFLSYPLEDVTGFVCNKGQNCTHCGYWKVYGDKEKCMRKFMMYDKCRDVYLKLWIGGRSILQLTVAA